ncbi:MAG: DNA mismatch repair protein MutS [Thermodesulfovibrionales bacterium]
MTQDLELSTLFNAMAIGDKFLFETVRKAILSSLTDKDTILYRQDILKDCIKNPTIVRNIYAIAEKTIERRKGTFFGIFTRYPGGILRDAIDLLQILMDMLKELRNIADAHSDKFKSEGFTTLFAVLKKELSDEYFANVHGHLSELKFKSGVLISAELGKGNNGKNYTLRKLPHKKQNWMERIIADYILPKLQDSKHAVLKRIFTQRTPAYTFYLHPRDESGARALTELRDRGIHLVANALAQSADHILNFFKMLRTELAFYVGCLNLYEKLPDSAPISFPVPAPPDKRLHSFKGLYDISLTLTMERKVVSNDIDVACKELVIITGANQGGKSTFLRSIGLAQLMMQCGMFVPAKSFSANICEGIFTHYKREEDIAMKSGKLDEELMRMSDIVDHITSNSLLLFNESFAATNEREGSEIARQIVTALLEKRIKVFFVTHLYEFAQSVYDRRMENIIFLQAERQADGRRTFKLIEGEPLQTSFGIDVYKTIFGKIEEEL